jgi:CHAT domain-containing protein
MQLHKYQTEGKALATDVLRTHIEILQLPNLEESLSWIKNQIERFGELKLDWGADQERIRKAVLAMFERPGDAQRIIRDYPEVKSPEADLLLESLLQETANSPDPVDSIIALKGIRHWFAQQRRFYAVEVARRAWNRKEWAVASKMYLLACDSSEVIFCNSYTRRMKQECIDEDSDLFQRCSYSLLRLGHAEQALLTLERGKARLLGDVVRRTNLNPSDYSSNEDAVEAYRRARGEFTRLEQQERGRELTDIEPSAMQSLARALSGLSPDALAELNARKQKLEEIVQSDAALAVQFNYVLPLLLRNEPYQESPYYNKDQFERLMSLTAELRKGLNNPSPKSNTQLLEERLMRGAASLEIAERQLGITPWSPSLKDIEAALKAVSSDSSKPVLIYLFATPYGAAGVVVTWNPDKSDVILKVIEAPQCTDAELRRLLFGEGPELDPSSWFGSYSRRQSLQQTWRKTLCITIDRLWLVLMSTIAGTLVAEGCDRAVLMPSGLLSFVPLHAIWNRTADHAIKTEEIVWSYSPSATLLCNCHLTAEKNSTEDMVGIVNPEPSTYPALPWANEEITIVTARFYKPWGDAIFAPRVLAGSSANRELVRHSLNGEYHPIVHFSAHASTDWADGDESGIYLAGDEKLRIRELFRVEKSTARLALLGACESGIPVRHIPDESLTLPAVLLGTGFACAVASLWAVEDISTTLLGIRFYEEWLDNKKSPAVALHIAQRWLRTTSNTEKCDHLSAYSAKLKALSDAPEKVRAEAIAALSRLQAALVGDANAYQFRDPYHWAAFFLLGL